MTQTTIFDRDHYPAEQFETTEQQAYTAQLGMWAFLATEVLFIGSIFVAFYVYRMLWPEGFAQGARELKWPIATINTAVLLASSFTMALAVHTAKTGEVRLLRRFLRLTLALGSLFIAIKFTEYAIEYHDHLVPGVNYADVGPDGLAHRPEMKLFMTFYFVLTGLHACHMLAGLAVLWVLLRLAKKGRFHADYHHPVEVAGLYWHFVDLVWVFVLPTLYLLRHA